MYLCDLYLVACAAFGLYVPPSCFYALYRYDCQSCFLHYRNNRLRCLYKLPSPAVL